MKKEELIHDLWTEVETTTKGLRLGIGSDCEREIRGFIGTGANRLEEQKLLSNYRRIADAENNLIAFVGGMAYEARLQNLSELREVTFFAASKSFCPLWPFC